MQVFIFLAIALIINVILAYLVQVHNCRKELRIPIWGLAVLLPIDAGIGYWAVNSTSVAHILLGTKIYLGLNVFVQFFLIEFITHFLSDKDSIPKISLRKFTIPVYWIFRLITPVIMVACFLPGYIIPNQVEDRIVSIMFSNPLIPLTQLIMVIYALYMLENTFRFAQQYQRKIGRLCFLTLGILSLYQLFFYSRIMLYDSIVPHHMDASSVIYGITYPVMVAGFLRYRLGTEKVLIPRDVVYTSATLFLTGAMFLGVAFTAFIFQWLGIDFSYFENFLLGFSLCFFIALVLGSGTMRKRIIRLVNDTVYTQKYDYRKQFFQLHKTIMSGTDLGGTVTDLVENMKYSVTVDDAFIYFRNTTDGNFYFQENKEQATDSGYEIRWDSELVKALEGIKSPLKFLNKTRILQIQEDDSLIEPQLGKLKIEAIFPILNRDQLVGILALRGGRIDEFEEEDLELIQVFTNSLGDVIFKNRVVMERIEQKQFESFNHIASFIIHDVKNQIATLSLLMDNAEKNSHNPEFQKSMLHSVKNCSKNLQSLIAKITVLPKPEELIVVSQKVNPVLEDVIENSGIGTLHSLELTMDTKPDVCGQMDRQSLYFVLKNLVQNALDAMRNEGALRISTGFLHNFPAELQGFQGSGPGLFSAFTSFIFIRDSGHGMSPDYIRTKLFRPFSTTKENGVGIGLYQCKSLVERMGGKILCRSELEINHGTEFCILLK